MDRFTTYLVKPDGNEIKLKYYELLECMKEEVAKINKEQNDFEEFKKNYTLLKNQSYYDYLIKHGYKHRSMLSGEMVSFDKHNMYEFGCENGQDKKGIYGDDKTIGYFKNYSKCFIDGWISPNGEVVGYDFNEISHVKLALPIAHSYLMDDKWACITYNSCEDYLNNASKFIEEYGKYVPYIYAGGSINYAPYEPNEKQIESGKKVEEYFVKQLKR